MSQSQPIHLSQSLAVAPAPRRSGRTGRPTTTSSTTSTSSTDTAPRSSRRRTATTALTSTPPAPPAVPTLPGVHALIQHYLGDLTRAEQQTITHAQSVYLQSAIAQDERLPRYSRPLTADDLEVTLRVLRGLYAASGKLRDMTPDLTLRGAVLWLSVLWMQALDQELAHRPSLLGYLWYKSSALDAMQEEERAFADPLSPLSPLATGKKKTTQKTAKARQPSTAKRTHRQTAQPAQPAQPAQTTQHTDPVTTSQTGATHVRTGRTTKRNRNHA